MEVMINSEIINDFGDLLVVHILYYSPINTYTNIILIHNLVKRNINCPN